MFLGENLNLKIYKIEKEKHYNEKKNYVLFLSFRILLHLRNCFAFHFLAQIYYMETVSWPGLTFP